jgi:hypothetical protein
MFRVRLEVVCRDRSDVAIGLEDGQDMSKSFGRSEELLSFDSEEWSTKRRLVMPSLFEQVSSLDNLLYIFMFRYIGTETESGLGSRLDETPRTRGGRLGGSKGLLGGKTGFGDHRTDRLIGLDIDRGKGDGLHAGRWVERVSPADNSAVRVDVEVDVSIRDFETVDQLSDVNMGQAGSAISV